MQVFLQIVAFSLQIIGSDRPVPTKGKRPLVTCKSVLSVYIGLFQVKLSILLLVFRCLHCVSDKLYCLQSAHFAIGCRYFFFYNENGVSPASDNKKKFPFSTVVRNCCIRNLAI